MTQTLTTKIKPRNQLIKISNKSKINKFATMTTERRPSDDLQPGEHDHKTPHQPTHFKYTVWWVEKTTGSDRETSVIAESKEIAEKQIETEPTFGYIVRTHKAGDKLPS